MKRAIKCFFVFAFSVFLMTMFSTDSVKANYEDSKNKLYLSITNEEIKITIQYQRGIVKDDTTLILCKGTIGKPTCDSPVNIPLLDKESREYISNKDATIADNEITKQSFVILEELTLHPQFPNHILRAFVWYHQNDGCCSNYMGMKRICCDHEQMYYNEKKEGHRKMTIEPKLKGGQKFTDSKGKFHM